MDTQARAPPQALAGEHPQAGPVAEAHEAAAADLAGPSQPLLGAQPQLEGHRQRESPAGCSSEHAGPHGRPFMNHEDDGPGSPHPHGVQAESPEGPQGGAGPMEEGVGQGPSAPGEAVGPYAQPLQEDAEMSGIEDWGLEEASSHAGASGMEQDLGHGGGEGEEQGLPQEGANAAGAPFMPYVHEDVALVEAARAELDALLEQLQAHVEGAALAAAQGAALHSQLRAAAAASAPDVAPDVGAQAEQPQEVGEQLGAAYTHQLQRPAWFYSTSEEGGSSRSSSDDELGVATSSSNTTGSEDEDDGSSSDSGSSSDGEEGEDVGEDGMELWRMVMARAAAAAAAGAGPHQLLGGRARGHQRQHRRHGRREGMQRPGPGVSGSQASTEDGVLVFSDDEEDVEDTTAEQVAATGRDIQGIPWERLQFSRAHYRDTRLRQYRNYVNVLPEDPAEYRPGLLSECQAVQLGGRFVDFVRNNRSVHANIVHFQLRNLVWATSRNDIFLVHDNVVMHWSPATRQHTEVLNLAGGAGRGAGQRGLAGLGRVQVSTMCVAEGLVAAGGFGGELVVKALGAPPANALVYAGRVTNSENGITNGLEVFSSPQHGACVVASNNDAMVRMYSTQGGGFRLFGRFTYPWAVNFATMRPEGHVLAVVGDDPETHLTDMRSGNSVAVLRAHLDYSFAAAWHPAGNLLATGNQDTTTVVWDVRSTAKPLVRLAGRLGAIRSLRFSPDGALLAAAEPADFVTLFDAASGFKQAQEIDLFGEIAGVSFTPLGDALFVSIADVTYSSLLQYERAGAGGLEEVLAAQPP